MKNKISLALALALFGLGFLPCSASAADITECGASQGWSYYFPSGGLAGEMTKDGLTNGRILLTITGDDADIIYKDVAGTRSAVADGGKTFTQGSLKLGYIQVFVLYPGHLLLEHYLFQLDSKGTGSVAWGQSAGARPLVNKASLFVAQCKKP